MELLEIITERVLVLEDGGEVLAIDSGEIEILAVAEQGPPGPSGAAGAQGQTGPQGIPGTAGSDLNYTHTQLTPSASWTVTHNLGKRPAVAVVDSAGSSVVGEVTYLDDNTVQLDFSGAFAGIAYFN